MSPTPTGPHGEPTYAVRVQGRLGARWSAWFDGVDIRGADDGTTTLRGVGLDQAALHGLLQKVRDVGLPIVSVTQVTDAPVTDATATPGTSSTSPEGH
jgi:hypothetical protein